MRSHAVLNPVLGIFLLVATAVVTAQNLASILADDRGSDLPVPLTATVVATGIPGAGAIAQVGTFHKGGPFAPGGALAAASHPVLDRTRLLVASTSNFGAPLARPLEAPGSILSLDLSGGSLNVPSDFARPDLSPPTIATGQPYTQGGAVILYTAQSRAFLNGNNNAGAVTADRPSVSLPLGISLNNGFGRPWFANAPNGANGEGTLSVTDPSGIPLAGAPDPIAGGVFAGYITNRQLNPPDPTEGLTTAVIATALATKSPDLAIPQRAVFFAALADGSIAQVHVQKGVDSLLPAGSFTPIPVITTWAAESTNLNTVTRAGMLFNWAPTRILYVSDPLANRILAVDISDEGVSPQTLFAATNPRDMRSPLFDIPIDIAPAVPEVAARNFASNTTLGAGSDLYVLNRGNNSIVRMTQAGKVVAVRQIDAPAVPGFRVNGLTVSEDARTIWVTATTPGHDGVVLQMSTFGAGPVTTSMVAHAKGLGLAGAVAQGSDMFGQELAPEQGLGPLFNGRSCDSCHNTSAGGEFDGGMGTTADTFVNRVGRITHGVFDPLSSHGGPIARQHSISELGFPCGLPTGDPPQANVVSNRSAMTLRGTSLIDTIRIGDIDKVRSAQPAAVRGRFNVLADGRIGRFGWKAQTATLVEFMGEAFRDEIGITNPLAPRDFAKGCTASILQPEADAAPLTSLVAFLNTIDPPTPTAACRNSPGAVVFTATGCATCHKPSLPGPGNASDVFLYSDLLLHDMGGGLADGFVQGSATGSEFRTAPLWRVADRAHLLHDGRAQTISEAIGLHGGQAARAAASFRSLGSSDLQVLLDFLSCI
ncbi:MAG TPA: di-heme oxidoredictase family protein [Vicinamibacterales bacterium]|nr:di-heme oxidoredictase family protein [Vicinamibacterales bacterium]